MDNVEVLEEFEYFFNELKVKIKVGKIYDEGTKQTLYFAKYTKEEYNRKLCEKFLKENYENSLIEFIKQMSGGEYLSKEDAQKIINILEDKKKN